MKNQQKPEGIMKGPNIQAEAIPVQTSKWLNIYTLKLSFDLGKENLLSETLTKYFSFNISVVFYIN